MAIGFYQEQGNGGVKVIEVEGGKGEEKEVLVHHEMVSSKRKRWSDDYFPIARNRIYSIREREKT